jgi:hypothetical protein
MRGHKTGPKEIRELLNEKPLFLLMKPQEKYQLLKLK